MSDATASRSDAAQLWGDEQMARSWMAGDDLETMLELPRRIAVSVAGRDLGRVGLVIDVASGPGGFLEVALDRFPGARGVWFDVSEVMREAARERLSRFGDRVSFVLGDMASLASAGLPNGADLIVTSRATHHLLQHELGRFYRDAVSMLAERGWIANLDHLGLGEPWEGRLRESRKELRSSQQREPGHHHDHGRPSLAEHLEALRSAGVDDVETPWRAFYTTLILARAGLARSLDG